MLNLIFDLPNIELRLGEVLKVLLVVVVKFLLLHKIEIKKVQKRQNNRKGRITLAHF